MYIHIEREIHLYIYIYIYIEIYIAEKGCPGGAVAAAGGGVARSGTVYCTVLVQHTEVSFTGLSQHSYLSYHSNLTVDTERLQYSMA